MERLERILAFANSSLNSNFVYESWKITVANEFERMFDPKCEPIYCVQALIDMYKPPVKLISFLIRTGVITGTISHNFAETFLVKITDVNFDKLAALN